MKPSPVGVQDDRLVLCGAAAGGALLRGDSRMDFSNLGTDLLSASHSKDGGKGSDADHDEGCESGVNFRRQTYGTMYSQCDREVPISNAGRGEGPLLSSASAFYRYLECGLLQEVKRAYSLVPGDLSGTWNSSHLQPEETSKSAIA